MRIARFVAGNGAIAHGFVEPEGIAPIATPPGGSLMDWLALGLPALTALRARALQASQRLAVTSVRLLPPIARPGKFLITGGNYASHRREVESQGITLPAHQVWCNKQASCLTGAHDPIVIPLQSDQVDYEGELAVVIGRRCRRVTADEASAVIGGYMICNDVSVRDVQMQSPTMMLGKSFDTHGPVGPWLVTPEEIPDPQNLRLRTWVNGQLRQDAMTNEMRYPVFEQIAYLSQVMTLEPGDVLATGTPAGVGVAMRPPRFLSQGDTVRIEIERIGTIENPCVHESRR